MKIFRIIKTFKGESHDYLNSFRIVPINRIRIGREIFDYSRLVANNNLFFRISIFTINRELSVVLISNVD